MDYKILYEKVLEYLAYQECPICPPEDEIQYWKCRKCMESDSDVLEKRIKCWNKKFIEQ